LTAELESHLDRFVAGGPDAVVFVGERGGPLAATSLYPEWWRATDALGWERGAYRIHDLRHAAATLYASLGATQRELMSHVGHSSAAAAMRYQHAAASRAADLAERLELAAERGPRREVG
jgi:integrase